MATAGDPAARGAGESAPDSDTEPRVQGKLLFHLSRDISHVAMST